MMIKEHQAVLFVKMLFYKADLEVQRNKNKHLMFMHVNQGQMTIIL